MGVRIRSRMQIASLAALGLALALPGAADATVTIGSDLARTPDAHTGLPSVTFSQAALSPGGEAPGGLVSPVYGVVTQWRIRAGSTGPVSFQVVEPLSGGLFTGWASTPAVTPAANAISSHPANLTISIGDGIALRDPADDSAPSHLDFLAEDPGATLRYWAPELEDHAPGRAPAGAGGYEILLNADIEPYAGFGIKVKRKLKGGKLKLSASLPNAGTLVAGDSRDPATGGPSVKHAGKASKKKKPLLRHTVLSAPIPDPQTFKSKVVFKLKPTKAARKLLGRKARETGRKHALIKVKLRFAFTPVYGDAPRVETFRTKLRR
jgi:hypothetical protein